MRRTATLMKLSILVVGIVALAASTFAEPPPKVGPLASRRAALGAGTSRVIVTMDASGSLPDVSAAVEHGGGTLRRNLPIINAVVADVPNPALTGLANNPHVLHIALDRLVVGTMERTGATIGSTAVRQELGYDGSGVGVAVIDSGVTPWHDDLTGGGSFQRVDRFVDFVGGHEGPTTITGTGRTSPASSRGTGPTRVAGGPASRPTRA